MESKKSKTSLELFGYLGAALLIGAYALVSFNYATYDSLTYQGMNVSAAIIYGIYAIKRKVIPVLVVQLFWGTIGIAAIVKMLF